MSRGFYMGRFQPCTTATIRCLSGSHPGRRIVIGVGSAQLSHTMANPYGGERCS